MPAADASRQRRAAPAADPLPQDRAARAPRGQRAPRHAPRDRAAQRREPAGRQRRGPARALHLHGLRALHPGLDRDHLRPAAGARLPPDHRRLRRPGRGTGLRLHRGHLLAGGTGRPRRLVGGDLRGLLRRHRGGARAPRRRDAPHARHHAGLRPGARRGDGAARRRLPRAGRGRHRARRARGPAGAVRARLRRRARGRSRLGASRRRGGRTGLDLGRAERPEGRPHPPRHQGGRGSGAARGAGARAAPCST